MSPRADTLQIARPYAGKTGRPVRFELSEQTGQAVDDYLKATNKKPGVFLFAGRPGHRGAAARDRGGTGKSGKRGSGDDRDHD
jgi:hypothetical protein